MSTSKSYEPSIRHRGVALAWLFFALIMLVVTVLLWMFSAAPNMSYAISNEPIQEKELLVNSNSAMPQITDLDELSSDVQPISYDDVVYDLHGYPPEFQDKHYINKNKEKWTVQVMNVAEHEVITDYLKGRTDREKFAYFRFLDNNNQSRYMLTYGLMNSAQEAMGAARLVDFGLPKNIRVIAEQVGRYIGIIDNYEKGHPMENLSQNIPREVRLQATKKEVPVKEDFEAIPTDEDIDNAGRQGAGVNKKGSSKAEEKPSIRLSNDRSDTLSIKETREFEKDKAAEQANSTAQVHTDRINDKNKAAQNMDNLPKPKPFDPNQFPNQKIVADGDMSQ